MKLMYKYVDKQRLIVAGHLNAQEIKELRHEGYKFPSRQNNHKIRTNDKNTPNRRRQ